MKIDGSIFMSGLSRGLHSQRGTYFVMSALQFRKIVVSLHRNVIIDVLNHKRAVLSSEADSLYLCPKNAQLLLLCPKCVLFLMG